MVSVTHCFKSAPQWLGQGEGLKGGAGHVKESLGQGQGLAWGSEIAPHIWGSPERLFFFLHSTLRPPFSWFLGLSVD